MMRVVYYSHTAFFEVALSMASALAEVAEVHLVLETTPTSWKTAAFDVPPLDLPAGLIDADPHLAPYFPAGVRERWMQLASFTLASHRTRQSIHPRSIGVSRQVLAFASQMGADVLHIDDVDVTPRLALALPTHRAKTPIVLTVHDPSPHSGEDGWRKTVARRIAFPRVDRFVLHNRSLADGFADAYQIAEDRVHTVRLGAYELLRAWLPQPACDRSSCLVTFTGRISAYKGVDVLYAAMPIIARGFPAVRFRIAGQPVSGYAMPTPPAPSVYEIELDLGYQSNADLAATLAASSIIVCPYRDATQSGIVLSAFGFDTPVVASDTGGLREYVDDGVTGILVRPEDPEALADAVIRLLQDPARLAQMSRAIARSRRSEALSFRRAASELLEVYSRVAD